MRRTSLLLAAVALIVPGSSALGLPPEVGAVLTPDRPGRAHEALLVLLPAAGQAGSAYSDAARAAQRTAGGTRLWVAVGDVGAGPAAAVLQHRLLVEQARAAGYSGEHVVVAAWGDAARALSQIVSRGGVTAASALGSAADVPADALRVLAELDRSESVIGTVQASHRVLVLPGIGAEALRGSAGGAVLGDLVESVVTDPSDLSARMSGDRLVAGVRAATQGERGDVCAELQRTTGDLPDGDVHRLVVRNRASTELMAPTAAGAAEGDLGGFLYDKAELVDEGDTATVTTNSHAPAGQPAVEVMCKTKSRSAVAQAVYGTHLQVDDSPPSCADFTRSTVDWARAQLSSAAALRSGGVTVLPDLPKAAGPEWVFSPLLLRPADPTTGRWEVQSPALVTQLSDTELDPAFAGNHYCKVLSPVRALKLLLEDTVPVTSG